MYRSRRQRLGAYTRDAGVCLIEITLRELKQLFQPGDAHLQIETQAGTAAAFARDAGPAAHLANA